MTSPTVHQRLDRAIWRKSSRSNGGGSGNCVEATALPNLVAVRDSTDTTDEYPVLTVEQNEWSGLLAAIRTDTPECLPLRSLRGR